MSKPRRKNGRSAQRVERTSNEYNYASIIAKDKEKQAKTGHLRAWMGDYADEIH